MTDTIKAKRKPSTAQRFNEVINRGMEELGNYRQQQVQQLQMNQRNKALQQLTGQDLSGLSDDQQNLAVKYSMENQNQRMKYENDQRQKANELQGKQKEKAFELEGKKKEALAPFEAGLETIDQMRKIGEKNNLGRGSGLWAMAGGETARDKEEYERLGKSLISLSSNIPIRNKSEFETLAHDLFDSSLPDQAREGILNAMENIIKRNMSQYQEGEQEDKGEMDVDMAIVMKDKNGNVFDIPPHLYEQAKAQGLM